MAKVVFLILFIVISTSYFVKIENDYIHNHLICLFTSGQSDQTREMHLSKIKLGLPNGFPASRFEHMVQEHLPKGKTVATIFCHQDKKMEYEDTILYAYRPVLYPLFPDIFQTLDLISKAQLNEKMDLHNMIEFKKIVEQEREVFEKFVQDCLRIKDMTDQIRLLEKHLKIDKTVRKPTHISKKEDTESRMSRNILKQISFAKKHLADNEKLFSHKWKIYFEFESEQILCPR